MDAAQLAASLARIAAAPHPPVPWRDGQQLPWDDPEFSERMLRVHLDPDTHMASRGPAVIEAHIAWLEGLLRQELPPGGTSRPRLLDVTCGPGLYAHALARRGCTVTGLDFAPAPLRHASRVAAAEGLDCRFLPTDLNRWPEGVPAPLGPCDAVTFWYGEFHAFPPAQAGRILEVLAGGLAADGLLVLEYQPLDLFVQEDSQEWESRTTSVFADAPHLWLQESAWHDALRAEITVHWILDAATGALARYAQSHQAYTDEELVAMGAAAGLTDPRFYPPITGVDERVEFPLLVMRKGG